eukprot:1150199-Pelagomonas_calceolata.AAC.2
MQLHTSNAGAFSTENTKSKNRTSKNGVKHKLVAQLQLYRQLLTRPQILQHILAVQKSRKQSFQILQCSNNLRLQCRGMQQQSLLRNLCQAHTEGRQLAAKADASMTECSSSDSIRLCAWHALLAYINK